MKKCTFPHGVTAIKPDGVNELDPCVYKDIEKYKNVTVIVSRCINCGHISISWKAQDNTERIPTEDD